MTDCVVNNVQPTSSSIDA